MFDWIRRLFGITPAKFVPTPRGLTPPEFAALLTAAGLNPTDVLARAAEAISAEATAGQEKVDAGQREAKATEEAYQLAMSEANRIRKDGLNQADEKMQSGRASLAWASEMSNIIKLAGS